MPKGPQGQKRPADAIGAAVMVAKIAVGETKGAKQETSNRRKSGLAGSRARAEKLTSDRRKEISQKAVETRWSNNGSD